MPRRSKLANIGPLQRPCTGNVERIRDRRTIEHGAAGDVVKALGQGVVHSHGPLYGRSGADVLDLHAIPDKSAFAGRGLIRSLLHDQAIGTHRHICRGIGDSRRHSLSCYRGLVFCDRSVRGQRVQHGVIAHAADKTGRYVGKYPHQPPAAAHGVVGREFYVDRYGHRQPADAAGHRAVRHARRTLQGGGEYVENAGVDGIHRSGIPEGDRVVNSLPRNNIRSRRRRFQKRQPGGGGKKHPVRRPGRNRLIRPGCRAHSQVVAERVRRRAEGNCHLYQEGKRVARRQRPGRGRRYGPRRQRSQAVRGIEPDRRSLDRVVGPFVPQFITVRRPASVLHGVPEYDPGSVGR